MTVQALKKIDARPLSEVVDEFAAAFPERRDIVETMFDAMIAGEHVLLLGPPGTAKSLLARTFADALGESFFDILITRYTEPNELFGPYSLKAYEQDRYARVTSGYASDAAVWFLDEVFKGSSAILNSMLTAINERRMRDDGQWKDLDLRLCIGASNELPSTSDGLGAFHDRFLVRFMINYLADDDAFDDVMWGRIPKVTGRVDPAEIADMRKRAEEVSPSEEVLRACKDIRDAMRDQNIPCSDRRWHKAAKLLAARSARLGLQSISSTSLGVLENVLGNQPDEIPAVKEIVRSHVATWLREIREATAAIDEQEMTLKESMRKKGSTKSTATAIAGVGAMLTEIERESLDVALRDSPEAAEDVAKLRKRIEGIRKDMRKSMRKLGF